MDRDEMEKRYPSSSSAQNINTSDDGGIGEYRLNSKIDYHTLEMNEFGAGSTYDASKSGDMQPDGAGAFPQHADGLYAPNVNGARFSLYDNGAVAGELSSQPNVNDQSVGASTAHDALRPMSAENAPGIVRNKSLVRPERQRLDPSNPRFHTLARRATLLKEKGSGQQGQGAPSPATNRISYATPSNIPHHTKPAAAGWRGKRKRCPGWWHITTRVLSCYIPDSALSCFGMHDPNIRQAWREKFALVTIIIILCGAVGFLTFGFQAVLCGPQTEHVAFDQIGNTQVTINGRSYSVGGFIHPATDKSLPSSGNLLDGPTSAGGQDLSFLFQNTKGACRGLLKTSDAANQDSAGEPLYFFPCASISSNTTAQGIKASWVNPSASALKACHNTGNARGLLANRDPSLKPLDVFYAWENITTPPAGKQFFIFNGLILDPSRLDFLSNNVAINDPAGILKRVRAGEFAGRDATYQLARIAPDWGRCLSQIVVVGVLDASTVGCVISDVVIYISLLVIVGVVLARFFLAVLFGWFLSWRIGNVEHITFEERRRREAEIEDWTDRNNALMTSSSRSGEESPITVGGQGNPGYRGSIYSRERTPSTFGNMDSRRTSFLPQASRFSTPQPGGEQGRANHLRKFGSNYASSTQSLVASDRGSGTASPILGTSGNSPPESPRQDSFSASRASVLPSRRGSESTMRQMNGGGQHPHVHHTMPPPPPNVTPFNFPLIHTILLVTCYSEDNVGLRASFDSLCTTTYPNSHKMLLVICDGIVTGHGSSMSTPDICLSMLEEEIIPRDYVQPHSYVAIADGTRRHNMSKVYAGFYKYDDRTVSPDKQQRVPMVVVVKCGTAEEATAAKPGNRGKRDSQVLLMSFLQKVMFDERMTTLEYEFFNAIWSVTGVTPDNFAIVLMIDADTKVYPDALTRMVAVMARDSNVMGLCGETKIANKSDSWVTAIQVFEYYISHHLAKAFESIFGGVTCLPGCFCMYRIKAPKGSNGYWVPILANPDIVEHYSENVVDTLHKKNLLLLGEDRYLSTLMLRTFPKRKMLFVPQAVCKTLVPDTFAVLLSQRRRWINSTVHNLFELVLVRDLCGTFCFSMQFVIFAELVGTLVLPAAITFTFYLVIISIVPSNIPTPVVPLLLLAAVLGLPAILIMMTSRKIVYVMWMLVYLLSLPIWNFVLPVYAYWHFDDFSWGQTRMVEGEHVGHDHSKKEGEFDSSKIVMKRWCEFERDKRRKTFSTAFSSSPWSSGNGNDGFPGEGHYRTNSSSSLVGVSPSIASGMRPPEPYHP